MSRFLLTVAALGAACTLTSAAFAAAPSPAGKAPDGAHMCLRSREIENTKSPDGKTLLFYMRDGKVWRNTLRYRCDDLKFGGYTEVVRGQTICANQQLIRANTTGKTCRLGNFTRDFKAEKKKRD